MKEAPPALLLLNIPIGNIAFTGGVKNLKCVLTKQCLGGKLST